MTGCSDATAMKVLLIEDNPVDARLTQDLLDQWPGNQFVLQPVSTLSEGLTHLSRERFDVVLLDLSLPDTHGLSTVTQVLTTGIGVPVIVLSGHDNHALALQAIQQGAQDYLVKGQGGTEFLARAILYAIERKRAQERGVRFGRPRKLTPFQRQEALSRLDAGETQADIARSYGVDATTIGRLV